jgi:hypothetical protein
MDAAMYNFVHYFAIGCTFYWVVQFCMFFFPVGSKERNWLTQICRTLIMMNVENVKLTFLQIVRIDQVFLAIS